MAQLFRMRSTSVLAESALKKWRAVFQSHQNAQAFAVHYHRAQLQYKMLLTWRLELRAKLRMVKQAKAARKYLFMRRCIRVWAAKLEEKRRLQKLKEFDLKVVKRYFEGKSGSFVHSELSAHERDHRVEAARERRACREAHPPGSQHGKDNEHLVTSCSDHTIANHDQRTAALDYPCRRSQVPRARNDTALPEKACGVRIGLCMLARRNSPPTIGTRSRSGRPYAKDT